RAQIESVEEERRAAIGPDGAVLGRRLAWAEREHRAVHEERARDDGDVDEPPVHEELREVPADRRRIGRVGRPEVHEEHAGLGFGAHDPSGVARWLLTNHPKTARTVNAMPAGGAK